jgi:TPR repeat protein
MLFDGEGLTRDVAEAIRLWSWAAERGEPHAQLDLAMIDINAGGHKDLEKSLSLLTQETAMNVRKRLAELSRA